MVWCCSNGVKMYLSRRRLRRKTSKLAAPRAFTGSKIIFFSIRSRFWRKWLNIARLSRTQADNRIWRKSGVSDLFQQNTKDRKVVVEPPEGFPTPIVQSEMARAFQNCDVNLWSGWVIATPLPKSRTLSIHGNETSSVSSCWLNLGTTSKCSQNLQY